VIAGVKNQKGVGPWAVAFMHVAAGKNGAKTYSIGIGWFVRALTDIVILIDTILRAFHPLAL